MKERHLLLLLKEAMLLLGKHVAQQGSHTGNIKLSLRVAWLSWLPQESLKVHLASKQGHKDRLMLHFDFAVEQNTRCKKSPAIRLTKHLQMVQG